MPWVTWDALILRRQTEVSNAPSSAFHILRLAPKTVSGSLPAPNRSKLAVSQGEVQTFRIKESGIQIRKNSFEVPARFALRVFPACPLQLNPELQLGYTQRTFSGLYHPDGKACQHRKGSASIALLLVSPTDRFSACAKKKHFQPTVAPSGESAPQGCWTIFPVLSDLVWSR
jgi:hypothetical protein